MSKTVERYRVPPKKAFRAMGLGKIVDGRIKCIAGFRFRWWCPGEGATEPVFVQARILRIHKEVTS